MKDFVLESLDNAGVKVNAIIDRTRPTTQKNAFVCGDYRLLKVDTLDNRSEMARLTIHSKTAKTARPHLLK